MSVSDPDRRRWAAPTGADVVRDTYRSPSGGRRPPLAAKALPRWGEALKAERLQLNVRAAAPGAVVLSEP
ncbi:hypothetical protein [Amycolatopsis thailandensis]|uniref:hypothetical protein n=1 Tax=Amycolatopsis thailandensis TaxID=589330 RepID=UPI00363D0533